MDRPGTRVVLIRDIAVLSLSRVLEAGWRGTIVPNTGDEEPGTVVVRFEDDFAKDLNLPVPRGAYQVDRPPGYPSAPPGAPPPSIGMMRPGFYAPPPWQYPHGLPAPRPAFWAPVPSWPVPMNGCAPVAPPPAPGSGPYPAGSFPAGGNTGAGACPGSRPHAPPVRPAAPPGYHSYPPSAALAEKMDKKAKSKKESRRAGAQDRASRSRKRRRREETSEPRPPGGAPEQRERKQRKRSRRRGSPILQAKFAAPPAGYGVCIKNIPEDLGASDLAEAFGHISEGRVEAVDIHRDAKGRPTGEALVIFAAQSDAKNAVLRYNGGDLNGKRLEVTLREQAR